VLAVEVEFLMGRAVAAQWEDRGKAEWPPHPQRLFSALVAAHGELQLGVPGEAALKWLEALPPPSIRADLAPSFRASPSYFVPVNDEAAKFEKNRIDLRHVLDRRNRQERFFPAVVPNDPVVTYQWTVAPGIEAHRDVLQVMVENATYLGHSSSPVRACLRQTLIEPTLSPSQVGDYVMRVPGVGRFDRLNEVHRLRLEDEMVQPPLGRTQRYGIPAKESLNAFSPEALVLAFESGPRLGLDSSLPLLLHLRNALLSHLGPSAPEVLTGHDSQGGKTLRTHLALMPLGFVNASYADGSLKGVALVLPNGETQSINRQLRSVLAKLRQLHLGPLGSLSIRLLDSSLDELKSLRFSAYAESSVQWASVTPVVLDRHPKKKGPDAATVIADSCTKSGLPRPIEVRVGQVSAVSGAPPVREFRGSAKQVDNRPRHHVVLRFGEPVRGPVLVGAGRYIGLGVCVPYRDASES